MRTGTTEIKLPVKKWKGLLKWLNLLCMKGEVRGRINALAFAMVFGGLVGRKRSGGWAWGSQSAPKKPKSVSAKVTRLQRQVALLKPETKTFTTSISTSNVTQAAGLIVYISDIQQGTNSSTRIGDSVRGLRFRIRGQIVGVNAAAARVMLIKDDDSNGVIPLIAGGAEAIFNDFTARSTMRNQLTTKRFSVMYDKYWSSPTLQYGANGGGYIDCDVKLSCISTYRANAGNNTDAGKHQYYFVMLVDDADTLDINAKAEFSYSDV